jgi:hypothetical protein
MIEKFRYRIAEFIFPRDAEIELQRQKAKHLENIVDDLRARLPNVYIYPSYTDPIVAVQVSVSRFILMESDVVIEDVARMISHKLKMFKDAQP